MREITIAGMIMVNNPAIAHVLIEFLFGKLIVENKDHNTQVEKGKVKCLLEKHLFI